MTWESEWDYFQDYFIILEAARVFQSAYQRRVKKISYNVWFNQQFFSLMGDWNIIIKSPKKLVKIFDLIKAKILCFSQTTLAPRYMGVQDNGRQPANGLTILLISWCHAGWPIARYSARRVEWWRVSPSIFENDGYCRLQSSLDKNPKIKIICLYCIIISV